MTLFDTVHSLTSVCTYPKPDRNRLEGGIGDRQEQSHYEQACQFRHVWSEWLTQNFYRTFQNQDIMICQLFCKWCFSLIYVTHVSFNCVSCIEPLLHQIKMFTRKDGLRGPNPLFNSPVILYYFVFVVRKGSIEPQRVITIHVHCMK